MVTPTAPLTRRERETVSAHVPLALRVAMAHRRPRFTREEWAQFGLCLLIEAVRRYDPSRRRRDSGLPVAFEDYAAAYICRGLRGVGRDRRLWAQAAGRAEDDVDFDPADGRPGPVPLEAREALDRCLRRLTPTEGRVVRLRFGIAEPAPLTVAAVAAELGLTRAEVQRQELAAIAKMREAV